MKLNDWGWKQAGQNLGLFTLGAAVGSAVALLFAPASGPVIRRKIGSQLRLAKRVVMKKASRIGQLAKAQIGQSRDWLVRRGGNHYSGPRRSGHRVAQHA